jgi:hypothetical protein
MGTTVAITESVEVARPPEAVFDFTQDYGRRTSWDATVVRADVLERDPPRLRVELAGGVSAVFQYRLFRRPERTSMAMVDVRSWWMEGGGGSWQYVATPTGTRWTATNSITLRSGPLGSLLRPLVVRQARSALRAAMRRAKKLMQESEPTRRR